MGLCKCSYSSCLPRAVSKYNTTILQFKPLSQTGCCLGEFVTFFSPDLLLGDSPCPFRSTSQFPHPKLCTCQTLPINLEQTDAVCCPLSCLFRVPVTVVAHQIQGSVPWCELGSCLFLPLRCASFVSLSPLWCHAAFSPCLLPGVSLLDATSRGCIGSLPLHSPRSTH